MAESVNQDQENLSKGLIAWMARNAIAANLLMFLLLMGGFWTAIQIQKEVFPAYELDIVEVTVSYPGAAPEEVEQGIILPVEQAIRGISGIAESESTAREGSGEVRIELVSGADRTQIFQDIEQSVSRIQTFPDDIEEPRVRLVARQREVMEVVLYGNVDIWTLRQLAERLRDRFLSSERITQVTISRVPDYKTHIEIPRQRLMEYGITLGEVAQIISESSGDVSAGTVESSSGEILLRVKERKQWAREFEDIEMIPSTQGAAVNLGDLATIRDGFDEGMFHSQFNQQPSVELNIFRVGDQSPLEISDEVLTIMDEVETNLPPGVSWRIDGNRAKSYGDRLSLLTRNGLMALIIVIGVLALFLEVRLAFWVMMGMATSFIGGLIFLPMIGVSINMISMFAFLVVLGIVVDDAIVVGENTYENRQKGMSHLQAAITGAKEVALPVTFSILTNIIAFIPLLFIPGVMGKFWWPIPAVVITVLSLSLFEALYILPSHLAHSKEGGRTKLGKKLHEQQQKFSRGFTQFVNTHYRWFLELTLRNRYITVCSGVAIFFIVGGYATSSHMGMIFMPAVTADEIEAGVRLPIGTTPDEQERMAADVTSSTMAMFEKHNLSEIAQGVKTNVRRGSFVDVEIVLKAPDEVEVDANEVIELWRNEIGDIPGVDQITFEAEGGPGSWRKDIVIALGHDDIEMLEKASSELVERARAYAATKDVNDDYYKGKTQIDFMVRPEARNLGLTSNDVGRQVRDAFFGALAMRQMRGTNEIEVRVKLPLEERQDIYNLEEFILQTPSGAQVPLYDVVEVKYSDSFNSIKRTDGRRAVRVSMNVEPQTEMGQVSEALMNVDLPDLRASYPGLTWTFRGSQASLRESTTALWSGLGIAIIVIYCLLAVAFGSYVQPFIVLVAIPFGIIGAVIGHIILGYDISLVSIMGVIALSGVVVNDSLIMVDYANRKRKEGTKAYEAIHQAGLRRFRPIILTTLTTFAGLTPIILETSTQAQYLIPMAISLGFGIIFSTSIIL
ncbi:MAG: efflux RND transporter permease subunit, partial [Verrucomicrobiota bacterium]